MNAPPPPSEQKPPVALNPVLLWVSGGAFVLFVCFAFGLFILMTRTEPLAQQLVREARHFADDDWPRPSHFDPPVPGRFAQAIAPLLEELSWLPEVALSELTCPRSDPYIDIDDAESIDFEGDYEAEMEAFNDANEALVEQCRLVSRGEAPLETVPFECIEVLRQHRELLHRVLATTRVEMGGLPEHLGSLSRPDESEWQGGINLLARVAELAALETRVLLAEGRPEEAVDTCVDGLALSRELSLGAGMYGLRLSARSHDTLFLPCAAALEAAPLERQREAQHQLTRLSQGYPPLSTVLREESVYQQLSTYGDLLSPPAIDALPPGGQALLEEQGSYYYEPGEHPRLRPYAWRRNAAMFDAMVAVADLPAEQRRKAFSSIDVGRDLVLEEEAWHTADYSLEADALEPQRYQALALAAIVEVEIARARLGTWPQALSSQVEKSFLLSADTDFEAWLVPADGVLGVPELRLAAPVPPSPRPRYAGGGLR